MCPCYGVPTARYFCDQVAPALAIFRPTGSNGRMKNSAIYWLEGNLGLNFVRCAYAGWRGLLGAARYHIQENLAGQTSLTEDQCDAFLPRMATAPFGYRSRLLISQRGVAEPMFEFDRWNALFQPDGTIRRENLLSVLEWLARHRKAPVSKYRQLLADPARTARLGHTLFCGCADRHGIKSLGSTLGLALLGTAIAGLQFSRTCQLCYRLCLPWVERCPVHSRHAKYLATESEQLFHVRVARKIHPPTSEPYSGYNHDEQACLRRVSIVLFPNSSTVQAAWSASIDAALQLAPAVQARLPHDFQSLDQRTAMMQLRRGIDELEWDPAAWPAKIAEAERFFEAEEAASPRAARHRRARQLEKVQELRSSGRTWDEIASELRESVNTLKSAWKRSRAD